MRRIRARLTYANVIATMALFLALGGSSYAALSVGTKQVKNNSLTSKDLKNNSVASKDIKNGSLVRKDFKKGQLGSGGGTGGGGGQGAPGAAGSAVAYGEINNDGTLKPGTGKNITNVTKANSVPNYFCITTSVPVKNVIAVQSNATSGEIDAMLSDPFTSCTGETATVRTYNSAGGAAERDFYIAFN